MGVFTCTQCGTEYSETRFAWEPNAVEAEAKKHVQQTGKKNHEQFLSDQERDREISIHDQITILKRSSIPDIGEETRQDLMRNRSTTAHQRRNTITCIGVGVDDKQDQGMPKYGDAVRATGTMTNVVGGVIGPASQVVCAPLSAACGAVGFASGAYQLHQGVRTPSGTADPHLIAKGSTTAFVGGTCMVLGASGLFIPALCLGAAGVGMATAIDLKMDGLCDNCRNHRYEDKKALALKENSCSAILERRPSSNDKHARQERERSFLDYVQDLEPLKKERDKSENSKACRPSRTRFFPPKASASGLTRPRRTCHEHN